MKTRSRFEVHRLALKARNLHDQGYTYRQIAGVLGYSSVSTVHEMVKRHVPEKLPVLGTLSEKGIHWYADERD